MTEGTPRVLVIDDEPQIRRLLRVSLGAQEFTVLEAGTAAAGLSQAVAANPDVIVLDLGLPDRDGQELISELKRASTAPIIVLSVRADEREKVKALDAGANDYVVKPFGMPEFIARLRAALRNRAAAATPGAVYRVGQLVVDVPRHRVSLAEQPIKLSPREFDLLALLAANPGRVLTHRQLLRTVWGPGHEHDTQYLRVYIGQLRDKLGDDPDSPRFVANEPGVGYRLLDPADANS